MMTPDTPEILRQMRNSMILAIVGGACIKTDALREMGTGKLVSVHTWLLPKFGIPTNHRVPAYFARGYRSFSDTWGGVAIVAPENTEAWATFPNLYAAANVNIAWEIARWAKAYDWFGQYKRDDAAARNFARTENALAKKDIYRAVVESLDFPLEEAAAQWLDAVVTLCHESSAIDYTKMPKFDWL